VSRFTENNKKAFDEILKQIMKSDNIMPFIGFLSRGAKGVICSHQDINVTVTAKIVKKEEPPKVHDSQF